MLFVITRRCLYYDYRKRKAYLTFKNILSRYRKGVLNTCKSKRVLLTFVFYQSLTNTRNKVLKYLFSETIQNNLFGDCLTIDRLLYKNYYFKILL